MRGDKAGGKETPEGWWWPTWDRGRGGQGR